MSSFPSKRRAERRATQWVAECRINGRVVVGAVLDICGHGVFFSPKVPDADTPVSSIIRVGAPAAISFDAEPNLAGLDLPCRIRWIGYSEAHRRQGFGLEFTTEPI